MYIKISGGCFMIWHSSGIEAIKKELQFDEKQGLTGAEVAERIKKYGENRIFLKKGKSFSKVFTKYIFETRNILLTVLSIILLITGIITQKPLWFSPLFIIILIVLMYLMVKLMLRGSQVGWVIKHQICLLLTTWKNLL